LNKINGILKRGRLAGEKYQINTQDRRGIKGRRAILKNSPPALINMARVCKILFLQAKQEGGGGGGRQCCSWRAAAVLASLAP